MIKKYLWWLAFLLTLFFWMWLINTNAWNGLNDLFNTNKELLWKKIFVPLNIKVVDYSFYWTYKNVRVVISDWFNVVTVYNKDTEIWNDWLINLLINIDPTKLNINKNIIFKVYVNNELYSVLRKNIIKGSAIASANTQNIVDSHWKVISIDNLLLKNDLYNSEQLINQKINKYKDGLLKKTDIQNYVILKNGKLDYSDLPFSMNNLACDIKESDLSYLEQKLNINIDRTKIVYDYPCKDWMTDLDSLIKIIKAYNKDSTLIKNYNP